MPHPLAAVTAGLAPALILLLIALATDVWVYLDAERQRDAGDPVVLVVGGLRIESPQAWLVASLVLWVVAVPLYVIGRRR